MFKSNSWTQKINEIIIYTKIHIIIQECLFSPRFLKSTIFWFPWCYGNASTLKQTQKWVWVRFLLFLRIIRNPLKTKKCRGISEYFGSVSAVFTFDSFPVFLGLFLFFLGQFPMFSKSFKLSVCWLVSPFFGSVSSFFGSVSDFQKKL